jgi:uncharacterized membrane protein
MSTLIGESRLEDRVGAVEPERAAPATSFTDLIGGRGLAWIGGLAMLLGIVLLLALAISRGWIGDELRVIMAAGASTLLVVGGVWPHRRSGRTEAAVAMVGAGIAGMFATLVAGSTIYHLLPVPLALAVGVMTGAVAATLAIRWAGQAIAALGLLGALLTPILLGASHSGLSIVFVFLVTAGSVAVAVGRRWGWLGLGAVLLAEPQLAAWLWTEGDRLRPLAGALTALVGFALITIAGAAGLQLREPRKQVDSAAAALLVLSATILAVAGRFGVAQIAGATIASLWLLGLAAVHGLVAALGRRVPRIAPLRPVALAVAVTLADVVFALTFHGLVLSLGWGAAAVLCSWLAARRRAHVNSGAPQSGSVRSDEVVAQLGLGAHIALVLVHTIVAAPPTTFGTGEGSSTALAAVAALAAACLGAARFGQDSSQRWRVTLDGLGLLAIAYFTTIACAGPILVVAWSAEAVALSVIARRRRDPLARMGGIGFLALAAVHTMAVEVPPSALFVGVPSLPAAAVALIAVAAANIGLSRCFTAADDGVAGVSGDRMRLGLVVGAAAALAYLPSVAIIDVFQPATGSGIALLDLGVRQQGQVLLSVCWGLAGVSALLVGLRRQVPWLRSGALAVLLLVAVKVFLYDLSTLTSIYRVASFIALGLLLLGAGFAYGKLRPEGSA